jgi:hypothetical protein
MAIASASPWPRSIMVLVLVVLVVLVVLGGAKVLMWHPAVHIMSRSWTLQTQTDAHWCQARRANARVRPMRTGDDN